ncbi:uncharacterized protein LOC134419885 [Melospiza melodia melodia]|uniref:uncharacterized protein LOC134419885 n=1 Tax=Melospiza melodia melodia TaxID=1914991 RepID=UPI002FD69168
MAGRCGAAGARHGPQPARPLYPRRPLPPGVILPPAAAANEELGPALAAGLERAGAAAAGTGGCLGERSPHPARLREATGRNGSPVGETPSWVTGAAASAEGPTGLEQERLSWVFVRCLRRCRGRTHRPAHPSAEASRSRELAPSFCTATSGVFPEVASKLRHCGTDSPHQGRTRCWKHRPAGGRREHQEKGRNSPSGSTGFPDVEERCEAFMQNQNSSHCSKISQTTSLYCKRRLLHKSLELC